MMDLKPEPVQFTLLIYYCIINITAAVLTVTDKRRALGEFIAMLCIRHKTKHLKFVISMPVFIVLHIVLFYRIFLL